MGTHSTSFLNLPRRRTRWLFGLISAVAAGGFIASPRCLATTNVDITQSPYSVTPDSLPAAITTALQQAVDDVGAAGGGTVTIPAYDTHWELSAPIYVSTPGVTISGQGRGTVLQDGTANTGMFPMFILGMQKAYADAPLSTGHFPSLSGVFDTSVTTTKYGLRTWDGTTKASGYFSECAMTAGQALTTTGNPPVTVYSYWTRQPTVTFDFCIKNNGTGVMKGQILGIGAGLDRSSALTPLIANDKLTIFSLESDPSTGQNARFKFRMIDASGAETVQEIRLLGSDTATLGTGVHRFSVQIDFAGGAVASWYSLNSSTLTPEATALVSGATITSSCHFKQFEWGALRLGRVTSDPFSGTPSQGNATDGDWTYCGVHIANDARYASSGGVQVLNTGVTGPLKDSFRYFNNVAEVGTTITAIAYLPLDAAPASPPVNYVTENNGGANCLQAAKPTLGFWLPDRQLNPQPGTFTVQDLDVSTGEMVSSAIMIAEVRSVSLSSLNIGWPAGTYSAVGSLNCGAPHARIDAVHLSLGGWDSNFYATNAALRLADLNGYSHWNCFRLVGCEGTIDTVLMSIGGAVPGTEEYYVKCHSGQYGGPLSITQFQPDNEGFNSPDKGFFYLEPSLHPTGGANTFCISGCANSGTMNPDGDVITVADPPNGGSFPPGQLFVENTAPGLPSHLSTSTVDNSFIRVKSANWYGKIFGCSRIWPIKQWIDLDGITDTQCHIVTYVDGYDAPPTSTSSPATWYTTWVAGCSVIRIPNLKQNPNGPGTHYTEYRCTTSGTWGGTNPVFTGYNAVP